MGIQKHFFVFSFIAILNHKKISESTSNYNLLQLGQAPIPPLDILKAAVLIASSALNLSSRLVSAGIVCLVLIQVLEENWNNPP